ncbi:MAG: transcriptional regulator [Pirellula sp.]|jgi:DNA-binding transcriptional ArsR family regulator|nr:transcriptional regulator [Pirellula sp.]
MPSNNDPAVPTPGRFAYDGLQRAFHEKARLSIMTSLLTYPKGVAFSELKELCSLSDGNLNRHIEVLKEEGYVHVEKTGAGRNAKTVCTVTPLGRQGFMEYLEELHRVIDDAARLSKTSPDLPSRGRLRLT